MIGFNESLYILPFDHRGSFQTKMFGWTGTLSASQTAEITATKRIIYDGFKSALQAGAPKEKAGILVDEQFGTAILRDAAENGYTTACPAEKSGQEEFDFEYGEGFAEHIESFHPTFCKVLVRYNPEGDRALNRRQAARLKSSLIICTQPGAASSCSSCWCHRRSRNLSRSRETRRPLIC